MQTKQTSSVSKAEPSSSRSGSDPVAQLTFDRFGPVYNKKETVHIIMLANRVQLVLGDYNNA